LPKSSSIASMISAILLGAGESRRMGADKLSLPLGTKTVLERCLDTLIRSKVDEIILVVRSEPAFWSGLAKGDKVKLVFNPSYRWGMSSSIRRGLRSAHAKAQGFLIALGDQPFLRPATINTLIKAFRPGKGMIVIPCYGGKRGHPVLFDRCYLKNLLQLKGDKGGRPIIDRYAERVICVRTRSEGVIRDLDTWKDYKKACKMRKRSKGNSMALKKRNVG